MGGGGANTGSVCSSSFVIFFLQMINPCCDTRPSRKQGVSIRQSNYVVIIHDELDGRARVVNN